MIFSSRILLVTALIATLSGCHVLDPIKIHDTNTHEVSSSIVIRPDGLRFRDGRAGAGGIEFGYERHLGSDQQQIGLNHYVSLGNQKISGPQFVYTQADIQHAHIAYNHLFSVGRHFQLEPALGLSHDSATLTAQGSSPVTSPISDTYDELGVTLGLTPRWKFNRFIGIENRIRASIGFDGSLLILENPAIVVQPIPQLAVDLGYLWYAQTLETKSNSTSSNAELSFRGPSVALRLAF